MHYFFYYVFYVRITILCTTQTFYDLRKVLYLRYILRLKLQLEMFSSFQSGENCENGALLTYLILVEVKEALLWSFLCVIPPRYGKWQLVGGLFMDS